MKTRIYNGPNFISQDGYGKKRGIKTNRTATRRTHRFITLPRPKRQPWVFLSGEIEVARSKKARRHAVAE